MLEGRLVRLRALERADVERAYMWVNDREVTQYLLLRYPMSRGQEEKYLTEAAEQGNSHSEIRLAIETKDGVHIGMCGLHHASALTIVGSHASVGAGGARMNDIALLDATAQAELVRTKRVKPIELLEATIERIERINPQINAVVTPMYDVARKMAEGHLPDGPFTGVPFLMKDLGAGYAGVRQTQGSEFLKDFVSPFDSELTARYKQAGLVIAGKTNTPEFGLVPTTEPRLFGATRNPWSPEHSVGGSSGGSAAAVAAGIVPMAHANDGGGSIRIPASCCGLFGIKPSRARVPLGPLLGDMMGGLVCEHAVTHSVRDSAALLDATAGPELGDPYYAPPPKRPYAEDVGAA